MEKTAAVTVCLLLLLLLLVFSNSRAAQGEGASSLSTFLVPPAEATEDSWATKAPMPTARASFGVAVVNGKIYAIGGSNYDSGILDINEEYDPATNTWATKKPMPNPRCKFGIAVYQNKIYVIGGKNRTEEVTGANEVYDPLTDTWETKTSMPTIRCSLCANVVDGKIYLIGGYRGSPPDLITFNVNEVYDPSTDSWTTKAQVPTAVFSYASAVVNNKIYVIGGFDCSLNQIYDPETDTWSFGASIPTAVHSAATGATTGVVAPKRIYVLGGTGGLVPISLNQVYDPEGDVWTTGARMPSPHANYGVAVVNDMLYAIGGRIALMPLTAENEQYTPIGYGTLPPTISIVSPENKTYTVNNVSLNFTVSESTSWIGYSLDGQANITITGNTTLSGLPDGSHSLTVYAKDTAGNTGTSETIYFSIEPFPITWIAAAIAVIAIGGAALLVYFRKIRKTTGEIE